MKEASDKITTVCIPTCNRPEQLNLAFLGLIEHLKKYNRTPRILVVDDSEIPENAIKTKQICNSFQLNYEGKIECLDRNDRKEMAKTLAREKNVSEEVMHFALCGDKTSTTTIGSVRNTFLLKTRGEKILMLDDDVVYNFFAPIKEDEPVVSIQHVFEFYFLQDNEMPPRSVFKPIDIDLLSRHENMLGKKAGEILGKNAPEGMKDMEIIDTYMGAYGDSPMESHLFLPLQPNVQDKLKDVSFEEYQKIKNTRRIIQTPLSNTIYQGVMCIGMVMGVYNRGPVPPLFPNGRSEDLTFGVTRYVAFPLKVSAHIPIMIGHERPTKETRPPSYDSYYVTNMSKVIVSLILESDIEDIDPLKSLQIISEKIINIAKEPPSIFVLRMETQCKTMAREIADYTNNQLKDHPDLPDFWKDDMQSIVTTLNSPDPKLFMADVTKNPNENKTLILQKWIYLYGQLLKDWHKLL